MSARITHWQHNSTRESTILKRRSESSTYTTDSLMNNFGHGESALSCVYLCCFCCNRDATWNVSFLCPVGRSRDSGCQTLYREYWWIPETRTGWLNASWIVRALAAISKTKWLRVWVVGYVRRCVSRSQCLSRSAESAIITISLALHSRASVLNIHIHVEAPMVTNWLPYFLPTNLFFGSKRRRLLQ